MRDTLSRFKAHLAEDNKKRLAAASQILTKGHQVYISAFKTWKNKTQQEKIRNSEKAANELFKVIEQGLRENTYPIYQAKIEGRVKTEAFRKILNTYNSIQ
jgi:predicted RNA-binding Zn ribbon-like protein